MAELEKSIDFLVEYKNAMMGMNACNESINNTLLLDQIPPKEFIKNKI